jgi:2-dehydro-3-deoxyglucarate aldolase
MSKINRFRDAIENDGVVLGARASSFSPSLVEIYGDLGLDFVWLDFEHSGQSAWDSTEVEHLVRAAELSKIDLLVRIPYAHPPMIRKVLDTGVRNILVPRVDTAEETRRAVRATRFTYEDEPGDRGMASQRSSEYGMSENYAEREDKNVNVGVMIEKRTALENIEEILAVSDLGFVFVGPGDLSVQLGHPGDSAHADIQSAIDQIESASKEAGVPLGGISHDPSEAIETIESGYQIVRIGGEFESARKMLRRRMGEIDANRDR